MQELAAAAHILAGGIGYVVVEAHDGLLLQI